MANVQVTSFNVDGLATEQIIALNDSHRRYIAIQCQDAGGQLGIGEASVSSAYVDMADNDVWSASVNITSKFRWIGNTFNCVVFQDADSNVLLSSDMLMLSYDSTPIYYNRLTASNNPVSRIPVFS